MRCGQHADCSARSSLTDRVLRNADVVLPLADDAKRELRLRCLVPPDREQELLLQRLGLTLRERIRPPAGAASGDLRTRLLEIPKARSFYCRS
jgi:hypothetical protein